MAVKHFGGGKPVAVVLHGFSQHSQSMKEFAQFFGPPVLAPDLPGHGLKPKLPATMEAAVATAVDTVRTSGCRVLIGYSLGGRVALRAALELGSELDLLVLVSATAGISDERQRFTRQQTDSALATKIRTDGLAAFNEAWAELPIFSGLQARSAAWHETNRCVREQHIPAALAESLEGMGQGATPHVTDAELRSLTPVTMMLAGSADLKYVKEAKRMASLVPNAVLDLHPTAGHALLGEDPGWVGRRVRLRV